MSFDNARFIGWDTEGINEGYVEECKCLLPNLEKVIDEDGQEFDRCINCQWTEKQKLVLISVSTGETLYNENGLTPNERFNFIYEIANKYPDAIHVFFGGSYDFNKILEGTPKEIVLQLHKSKYWVRLNNEWLCQYRPRKELKLAHLLDEVDEEIDSDNTARSLSDAYIRLWDVYGFFQSSFLAAVKSWLGEDWPDYELIMSGKKKRVAFKKSDKDFMISYNNAEVKALAEIMQRLHIQLKKLNLKITRWDGAGAIAAEMFKRHGLIEAFSKSIAGTRKREKIRLNPHIEEATQYAYFGGRIESGQMGRYRNTVYNYDINSAYPFAASKLPDMNYGQWIHHEKRIAHHDVTGMSEMTIFRIRWYFHEDRLYYPFPFRNVDNGVIFPQIGERWIMFPEVKAAINGKRSLDRIEILEAWEFKTVASSNFTILADLYKQRQELLKQKDPAEYVLKLGLNSVYGKLCQRLGWNEQIMDGPRFHFLLFAAWITSFTRARIYDAIQFQMEDVIAINTDGIVTKQPLKNIRVSEEKEFGGWSLEVSDEILQLQSGVYWISKNDKWKEKARGLGRVIGDGENDEEREKSRNDKIISRIESIEYAWRNGINRVHMPNVKLLITSRKACISEEWFPRWGHWYIVHDIKTGKAGRSLDVACCGYGKRRLEHSLKSCELVQTIAAENIEWNGIQDVTQWMNIDNEETRDLGTIYNLPWITGVQIEEFDEDQEIADV